MHISQIARGLNWLHHKGVIHRDLKVIFCLAPVVVDPKQSTFRLALVITIGLQLALIQLRNVILRVNLITTT